VSGLLRTSILLIITLSLAQGCAGPNRLAHNDMFGRNVMFTVDASRASSVMATSFVGKSEYADDVDAVIESVLESHSLHKISQFSIENLSVEAVVAEISGNKNLSEVIRALDADSRVESVQSIRRFKLLSYNDPYFSLQNTVNGDRIEHIHEITTGKNVVVGLIDTGVDRRHPELADSIVYTNNFVAHDQVSFDLDEHGTAVAGVIGSAANNDLGIVGVAPDIRLMVFKACHQEPASRRTSCDSVSIIKALNDVLQQQPDILNLSLSGPRDEIIEKLLKSASSSGMVLVAAVDETQPFDRSFPASMEEVIAVGTSFRQDLTGEMVLAPGTDMLTTAPGATYGFKSGSSMATAYVSGIAALMKEKVPDLTSAQIYDYLLQSARLDENELPVVDMCSAVNQAANTAYRNCERVRSMAAHIENPTDQSSTGGLAN
jgi:subtilisin family serine protease